MIPKVPTSQWEWLHTVAELLRLCWFWSETERFCCCLFRNHNSADHQLNLLGAASHRHCRIRYFWECGSSGIGTAGIQYCDAGTQYVAIFVLSCYLQCFLHHLPFRLKSDCAWPSPHDSDHTRCTQSSTNCLIVVIHENFEGLSILHVTLPWFDPKTHYIGLSTPSIVRNSSFFPEFGVIQ